MNLTVILIIGSNAKGAGELTLQVYAIAMQIWRSEFDLQNPHKVRRTKLTPQNCPLTFTCPLWHVCPHTHCTYVYTEVTKREAKKGRAVAASQ